MACPTCSRTMQNIFDYTWWCHYCGTLKMISNDHVTIEQPSWMRLKEHVFQDALNELKIIAKEEQT